MSNTKQINLAKVYQSLDKAISGQVLDYSDRLNLLRFKHKLTDSESFEFTTNRTFSALQLKHEKDSIESSLMKREVISLSCDFELVPVGITNWELHQWGKVYLDSLDTKIARRIAYDINVAIGIKVSRSNKK